MLPTHSPFLLQIGIVFAYQFNATKCFAWLENKKIHQSSPKFHRLALSLLHPTKHLCNGEPQPTLAWADVKDISYVGAIFTGCIKVPPLKELELQMVYFHLQIKLLKHGSFWEKTPSGSMTFSTVLPLAIGCVNRFLNLRRLHLCLPLHVDCRGAIPTLHFWAFSAMVRSLFLIVAYEDTFFCLAGKKKRTMYGKINRIERLLSPLKSAWMNASCPCSAFMCL